MAEEKRNYKSFTGLKEFYYGALKEDDSGISGTEATRIKFLQNITISTPQDTVKAYGDDTIAEIAVSTDATTLTTQFHKLPIEDRAILYGLANETEIYGLPSAPNPPYVACMFSKTSEDGSMEHIAFTKGKFTLPEVSSNTKGESVEFGNDSTVGQFMSREIEGFDEGMTYLVASDGKGETTNRDALYQKVFGIPFPVEGA